MWKLDLAQSYFPKRVWVAESNDRNCSSAVLLTGLTHESTGEPINDRFLAIRDDRLCNLFVSQYVETNVKKINLGSTPLSLFYYAYHDLFVVIPKIEDNMFKLVFIDHRTKRKLNVSQASSIFSNRIYPVSLSEWQVKSRKVSYTHNHLLVGCIDRVRGSGMIMILELKKAKGDISVRMLNSWTESEAPYALSQMWNSTVLYSQGSTLYAREYLQNESKMGESEEVHRFTSAIKGITVIDDKKQAIVTTVRDSFFIMNYDGEKLVLTSKDSLSRSLLSDCLVDSLPDDKEVLTISDKDHFTITSVQLERENPVLSSHSTVAKVCVPFIPRIQSSFFEPLWTKETLGGFISAGLNGEVRLYEKISKYQADILQDEIARQQIRNKQRVKFMKLSEASSVEMDPIQEQNIKWHVINVDSITDIDNGSNPTLDRILHSFTF
ncbi:unnamed protein product [Ambrosiozyma monospora]|uniref:Unnamed protein product n=1 Tax=Ambrosiozyma monospora TaxID=43982 RepID=A0ACB5U6Z6_AMBMO|nr:unnamed protein product [Ambrosiozyma monospora]